jgi:hypothetical protein
MPAGAPLTDEGRAKAQANGRLKHWTKEQTAQHLDTLRQLLPIARSDRDVLREMRARFGFGIGRCQRLTRIVREEWAKEEEARRPHLKQEAVSRIMQMLAVARGRRTTDGQGWVEKPNLSAVVRLEALLADLQGTREPVKVDVDVRVSQTTAAVIYNMNAADVAEALARYRENVRLAEEYRRLSDAALPPAAE